MEKAANIVITGGAAAVGCYFFGSLDLPLQALLFFLSADFFTGFAAAAVKRNINSRAMWKGFIKKVLTVLAVAVGCQIDKLLHLNGALRIFFIYAFIGSELVSLVENLDRAGVKIPPKLIKYFTQFQKIMETKNPPKGE